MTVGMLFLSLLYIICICSIYFPKKHIETLEINFFSKLLIINILGLLFELILKFLCSTIGTDQTITFVFTKFFLIYILLFSSILVEYYTYISLENSNLGKKINFFRVILSVLSLIVSIFLCVLPVEFEDIHSDFCTGIAVQVLTNYCFILVIFCILMILFRIKKIKIKKCVPLIVFLIGMFISSLIQLKYPQITITTIVHSFVLFIMYNTIENPDIAIMEQLEKAKEDAEKANRAKSDFLSSMSHEIRTPLNAIIGFSEFIVETNDIEEAHSQAKDVVSASQTLLETVNGILDISKVESGKLEIVCDDYNVRELLNGTVKMAKARMGDKNLDFRVHIADDLPDTLYGDKGNLNKVIINLLTNAIKYTKEGYIDYSVQCVKNNDVCRLIITVKDSGIGIKKENIDKLFTRFQRFDEKNNGTIEGTGLGLAITKQLVEMMGGNIVVSSIYGEGSNFTVSLDQRMSLKHVEAKEEVETGYTFDFHDKKILVVDDNNLNLKLATRIFKRYNCDIQTCTSGFDCLELINKGNKYDMILLDDVMPKMLGSETLTRLKRIENFNTPVIALTANAVSGTKEKYLLLGFDEYLAKPIIKEDLEEILKKYLVDNKSAKKLSQEVLTSSKPMEIVNPEVKESILTSASSKDVVLVEKEASIATESTIVKGQPEEVEAKTVVEGITTKETNDKLEVTINENEKFTDYSNKKILVVDDNKLNLKVALKFLSRYHFQQDQANSGEECLQKIKDGAKYDIIFMDIMMPNMSGVETFHELQRIEGFNTPVVVALTADAVEGAQERYIGEGFAEYISKPIVRERLDKVIHSILDKKE